jgi:hypothetical protein
MVIWWLLGAFAASALVGFGVWLLLRRVRRRWVRISASVVSGTFIFVAAGAAFMLLGFAPASDEFHSHVRTFTIYVTTPGAWESWKGSERLELPSEDSGVRFTDGGLVPGEKFFDNLSVQKWPGKAGGSIAVNVPKLFQRIRISLPESVSQREDFSISIAIDRFGSAARRVSNSSFFHPRARQARGRRTDASRLRCLTAFPARVQRSRAALFA